MELIGQATVPTRWAPRRKSLDDAGFVMVALLVAMSVTAVWMSALLPAWRQQVQREKEAELIFRGEAIARAIYLYRQKNGQALPASLDTLVSQRFLRKKYIDPITGTDFLTVAGATPGAGRAGGAATVQGGIIGVRSTSTDTSIRIYNNQQTYSQWAFDFTLEQARAGAGAANRAPAGPPAGPGGRVGQPGGTRGRGGDETDPITPPGSGRARGAGPAAGGRGGR